MFIFLILDSVWRLLIIKIFWKTRFWKFPFGSLLIKAIASLEITNSLTHSLTHSVSQVFAKNVVTPLHSIVLSQNFLNSSLTLPWHFLDTSMTLPWHFHDTYLILPDHILNTSLSLSWIFQFFDIFSTHDTYSILPWHFW